MKIQKLLPYLLIIASSASIFAAPSEINYQGVLTDQQGNPINGVRPMQIKLYDAPTGGTLLYSEDLGNVPVQDGVYSFNFGANGTSNALTTETLVTANGTSSTFQKALTASTVIAGSISVTDGTYTWDQTTGSSNESEFGVSYSSSLRRVTVTYYNGAPAFGKRITASYRSPFSGIFSAVDGNAQPWIEVLLSGVAQTPRQKMLTVPFAFKAISVDMDTLASVSKMATLNILTLVSSNGLANLPFSNKMKNPPYSWTDNLGKGSYEIPANVKKIKFINLNYSTSPPDGEGTYAGTYVDGCVFISITNGSNELFTFYTTASRSARNIVIPVNLDFNYGSQYYLNIDCKIGYFSWPNNYTKNYGGGATLNELSLEVEVPAVSIW